MQNDIIHDLQFASNCALNADTQSEMLESVDMFSAVFENFGLIIKTKKTEVMQQPTYTTSYMGPTITVGGQKCTVADQFTYLGSTSLRTLTIDEEVTYRIVHASTTFCRLQTIL